MSLGLLFSVIAGVMAMLVVKNFFGWGFTLVTAIISLGMLSWFVADSVTFLAKDGMFGAATPMMGVTIFIVNVIVLVVSIADLWTEYSVRRSGRNR